MAVSPKLGFPYLEAAQSQKHVTVNDSLRALDALVHLSAVSRTVADPPASPSEGERYVIGAPATGVWSGLESRIAAYQDGAWAIFAPQAGWRLYVVDEDAALYYDGAAWRAEPAGGLLAQSDGGASAFMRTLSEDHAVAAGAVSDTAIRIPDRAIVFGVTARVTSAIGGATSWDLGVPGAQDRYGTAVPATLGAALNGVSSAPVAYYAPTPLRLTANGGAFAAGVVRLTIHYLALTPPAA